MKALSLSTTKPDAEKTRSDGAEVAGTHKILLAHLAKDETWDSLAFHYARGSVDSGTGFSDKKLLTSDEEGWSSSSSSSSSKTSSIEGFLLLAGS